MQRAFAPGRVNLIGEHTDYTGGLVLPMAIQLGTTVEVTVSATLTDMTEAISDAEEEPALLGLDDATEAATKVPPWARFVAAAAAEMDTPGGHRIEVSTTLPIGVGLSSSAAFSVALALALGFDGTTHELARLARRIEHRATGVESGLMDQLASAGGIAGHALLIDCATDTLTPVALPDGVEVVAVDSGQRRTLADTAYGERRESCAGAAQLIGPLNAARPQDLAALTDPTMRRRARHVVTENARARAFAEALTKRDTDMIGELMAESHRSLRDDYEVSTPQLDALVTRLTAAPGVFGARLTGAGFGGCAVALCEPGSPVDGWRLTPSAGARRLDL